MYSAGNGPGPGTSDGQLALPSGLPLLAPELVRADERRSDPGRRLGRPVDPRAEPACIPRERR